jgi:murein DD-endopeptidase MepM/ murein hydrolase activator NlpD
MAAAYSTSYNQMEKYIVEGGQAVKKGEVIGYVGSTGLSTGPHLHYEVMKDGKYVDPADYIGQFME